jgi:hypothetical protein
LESDFNEWVRECVMLNIDEAKIGGFKGPQVEASLRRLITESTLTVREKFRNDVVAHNFCNVILTTNERKPVNLPGGDRRYSVAPRQEKPLAGDTEALVRDIQSELPQFAGYLAAYKYNAALARKPVNTEERETLIDVSTTTPDRIARAFKTGDFYWFVTELGTVVEGVAPSMLAGSHAIWDALLSWAEAIRVSPGASTRVPATAAAAVYNFFMPEKFHRRPQEIGRLLGLPLVKELKSEIGTRKRGNAYRIKWITAESATRRPTHGSRSTKQR